VNKRFEFSVTAVRLGRVLSLATGAVLAVSALADDAVPALTTPITGTFAFQQTLPDLDEDMRQQLGFGRGLFNQLWNSAPARDTTLDGLGPTYNQSSCAACHLRNGRGTAPTRDGQRLRGMLVRLSVATPEGSVPHPVYGDQLQESAILGVEPEGRVQLRWVEEARVLDDGTRIALRRPAITLDQLKFGALDDAETSLRIAPQLVGMGLLEAVPAATLEALAATPRPDGISGQINRLPQGSGRLGWKANVTDLTQQSAAAFVGDMGLTSAWHEQENCPPAQTACTAVTFEFPDVSDEQMHAVALYQALLAVPATRGQDDPAVQQGAALFEAAGCQHCHLPQLETGPQALHPLLANRQFAPYTDLLLHDMGEGLADGRPDGQANGRQWRTAPLWGLGLVPVVNEQLDLLHDGRARSVLEAILWHGGEGAAAAARVAGMSAAERAALEAFVLSR